MGIWDKLKGELIDIIEWLDPTQDTMVYRFERYQNEIKNGAQLTVRESQMAVFVSEGQIADVFGPGMYALNTQNLPILATLKGWKYGFNSPFKAEVYFVNTKNFTDRKWGTKNPIILNDDRYGMLEIRSFGTYAIKIDDPGKFLKEIVGTDGEFTTDEIDQQLRSIVVTRFTDAVGESRIPVEGFAGNVNELSEFALQQLHPEFMEYGINLTKFLVENVSMPEEIKKEIFELSRLEKIDLDKLAKLKAAKAMEKAAENPSGAAGAGVGMGMGFAMANQMGNMFNQQNQQQQSQGQAQQAPAQGGGATPPPLPQAAQYWVAINGQQSGPYDMATIQNMIAGGQISRESLMWKQGMADWIAASQIQEVSGFFGSVPPPLPNA
ncbi:SPFH domain-containing protein [Sanyastnella coralliicola]|uniref:SPFH domain-containing protein n=1 Tax=Sanyastnella coralliicola TaxID=3069118 RepID=UPI0027B97122|nr:SPFH domain-containing protein [Longitalea sp. SCSIO 12813]